MAGYVEMFASYTNVGCKLLQANTVTLGATRRVNWHAGQNEQQPKAIVVDIIRTNTTPRRHSNGNVLLAFV
eukprot:2184661-Amphidinium_carterae.1